MEHPVLHDLLNNPCLSILLLCQAQDMAKEKLANPQVCQLDKSQDLSMASLIREQVRSKGLLMCSAYLEDRIRPGNLL